MESTPERGSFLISKSVLIFLVTLFSPWASPLVVVPKKDGNIRITVNYKRLNSVTVVGKLPIPRIDEVSDSLGEGKIFCTFDLASGFFQNAIHPDTVPLTAFCTSSGLVMSGFVCHKVPLRLQGAFND